LNCHSIDGLDLDYHFSATAAATPQWSQWAEWSSCTVSAGYGTKIRYRKCLIGSDSHDQLYNIHTTGCPGEDYDVTECDEEPVYCLDLRKKSKFEKITCIDKDEKTSDLDIGSSCKLTCLNGARLDKQATAKSKQTDCDEEGEWTEELGTCKPPKDACPAVAIDNGSLYCTKDWKDGSSCLLACNQNHYYEFGDDGTSKL